MRSATGAIQAVLVLGGRSEIAQAVVEQLATPRLERVVLAAREARDEQAPAALNLGPRAEVEFVAYQADDPLAHEQVLEAAGEGGDLDVVVVAFGALGQPYSIDDPVTETVSQVALNGAAAVGAAHAATRHLIRQGHGTLVVLSSVAAQRVRPQNAPYAAGKAALDGFTRALIDLVHGTDVHIVLVRPGFVHGRMTHGLEPAPFATTPDAVARDIVAAIDRRRSTIVWSPPALRAAMAGLRSAPGFLWRRLSQ